MNSLFVASICALVAFASAAPSGAHGVGAVLTGPSGIVTSAGPIGPAGHGVGLGLGYAGVGLGGLGYGSLGYGGLGLGLGGHGAVLAAPAIPRSIVAAPAISSAVLAGPALGVPALGYGYGLGHGAAGVITNGGGSIGVSAHGAAIRGPPTAPVVVSGPAGKVVADGLWGPTANIGLGAVGHGVAIGHGHGW